MLVVYNNYTSTLDKDQISVRQCYCGIMMHACSSGLVYQYTYVVIITPS